MDILTTIIFTVLPTALLDKGSHLNAKSKSDPCTGSWNTALYESFTVKEGIPPVISVDQYKGELGE